MEVLFCSTTFFFDPLLALGDAAMRCASWGVFSLVTSFYGNDRAKCPDKAVIIRWRFSYQNRFTAKGRLRFDWKKRSQDRECLRRKRERNDYRDYCTSHPRGTILAKELGHFGVVALPAFVMTRCAGLFGSSCLKTGHDYGVQKDCRKHDLIGATPPSLADRIECVVR